MLEILDKLVKRLNKIGIKVEIMTNHPWIYLHKINDIKVIETTSDSNHGFNIGYLKLNNTVSLLNTKNMFNLIRKYTSYDRNV